MGLSDQHWLGRGALSSMNLDGPGILTVRCTPASTTQTRSPSTLGRGPGGAGQCPHWSSAQKAGKREWAWDSQAVGAGRACLTLSPRLSSGPRDRKGEHAGHLELRGPTFSWRQVTSEENEVIQTFSACLHCPGIALGSGGY